MAGQLKGGKGKGAQASPKPLYGEICEQVKSLIDQGDKIPVTILAKLVKFKLISLKIKDKERRELEKKVCCFLAFFSFYVCSNFVSFISNLC